MSKEIFVSENEEIENVIYILLNFKLNGEDVYCNFNEMTLYSNNIEKETIFKEVITKLDIKLIKLDHCFLEKYIDKLNFIKTKNKICYWLAKGNELIFPERYEQWEKYVISTSKNLLHGKEIEYSLKIMEMLENNLDIEAAINYFLEINGNELLKRLIRELVFCFSSKGPDFWIATNEDELTKELINIIELKKQENIRLMENSKKYIKNRF